MNTHFENCSDSIPTSVVPSCSAEYLFADTLLLLLQSTNRFWLEIQRRYILLGLTVPMEMPAAAEKMRSQSSLESMKRATFFLVCSVP